MDNLNQPVTPPQTPDQMHSSFENSNGSKIIPIIIAIIILVLVGAGSYVLGTKKSPVVVENIVQTTPSPSKASATEGIPSPTPDPTSSWKTYKNDHYNFQFKYPTDLDLRLNEGLKDKDVQLDLHAYNPDDYFELRFLISTEHEGLLFEEKYGISESGLVSITFNDIVALKSSGYGGDGGWVYIEKAFFTHDDLTYYFSTGTADRKNLLTQILSTFKFSP